MPIKLVQMEDYPIRTPLAPLSERTGLPRWSARDARPSSVLASSLTTSCLTTKPQDKMIYMPQPLLSPLFEFLFRIPFLLVSPLSRSWTTIMAPSWYHAAAVCSVFLFLVPLYMLTPYLFSPHHWRAQDCLYSTSLRHRWQVACCVHGLENGSHVSFTAFK